jgi:hypothetical protein
VETIDITAPRAPSGPAAFSRRGVFMRTESVLGRTLKRWPWVVVAVAFGAALGFLLSAGPQIYTATASLQVTANSTDSNRLKQVAQTVERTVQSATVVDAAAEARRLDPGDLAARLAVAWQTDTDVVDVTVRGDNPDDVVADVQAMTAALDDFYQTQTAEQVNAIRQQGNQLLSRGRLSDDAAEAARRGAIGNALASRQEAAAAGSTTVAVLDPGQEAVRAGLSQPLAIVIGGFAGGAAGIALALLVPFRRRTVRTVSDVETLVGTPAVPAEWGPAEVAGLMVQSERHDLAVVAMEGAEEKAAEFGAEVITVLRSHGLHGAVVQAFDEGAVDNARSGVNGMAKQLSGSVHVLGHSSRAATRERLHAQALVLVTSATRTPLNLLSGQHDLQTAVLVPRGRHSVGGLKQILTRLRHSDPVVVIEK